MAAKLELTWPGKEEIFNLEPRILIEKPELSNLTLDPTTENILIHGDNLLALKALEKNFSGKIKCVYIDPPYNTGAAFEHYDDNFEHSTWLSLMKPRLELLRKLLSNDGSIWISIDDIEVAYLRILCDEIFGRNNFVTTIIWQKRKTRENRRAFSFNHDYIAVYAKNKTLFEEQRNAIELSPEVLKRYKNPDNDPRGAWQSVAMTAQAGHATPSQFYSITLPSGRVVNPSAGLCWTYTKPKFEEEVAKGNITFGATGNNVPRIKKFLSEGSEQGLTPETLWLADVVGTTDEAKKEAKILNPDSIFPTPKPERLLERIIHIATNPGDFVLDSFLGSGTTAAVALKMKRKFIGIEIGEHAYTHCKVRLDKIIAGDNYGGLPVDMFTQKQGYKFFELAPSLMQLDEFGEYVTNKEYNEEMLAQAVALHKGFNYAPDEEIFWKQSTGAERVYLYVTTQHVSGNFVASIHGTMNNDEFLIIACKSYDSGVQKLFKNIKIEKIPQAILEKCDYDAKIII